MKCFKLISCTIVFIFIYFIYIVLMSRFKVNLLIFISGIFVFYLVYLKAIIKLVHFDESYSYIKQLNKSILIFVGIVIAILTLFYSESIFKFISSNFTKLTESIEKNKKLSIEKTILEYFGSAAIVNVLVICRDYIFNFLNPSALIIQIFNVPFFIKFVEPIIVSNSQTLEMVLSLHNFSKTTVNIFYLGICEENRVKYILKKENWDADLYISKNQNKIPQCSDSLEKVEGGADSEPQIVNIEELIKDYKNVVEKNKNETTSIVKFFIHKIQSFIAKFKKCKSKKYKFCAVYYVQSDKYKHKSLVTKHFIVERRSEDKS